MTIETKPQDYTFRKGHRIGLNIQTEIDEWSVPKPYPGCHEPGERCSTVNLDWKHARTRLVLPVVDAPSQDSTLFR